MQQQRKERDLKWLRSMNELSEKGKEREEERVPW